MKRELLLVIALIGAPAFALADEATSSASCYTITNPDNRAYCRAKARHDPSTCYSIQQADLRAMCLSETR